VCVELYLHFVFVPGCARWSSSVGVSRISFRFFYFPLLWMVSVCIKVAVFVVLSPLHLFCLSVCSMVVVMRCCLYEDVDMQDLKLVFVFWV
jgi:hypothetical protein